MEQKVDFTSGGMATILVGHFGLVQEYKNHAQVKFLNCKEIENGNLENVFPPNTKVVILTEGISAYHYTWATSFARRKNIPFVSRKTTQAVYELLKGYFTTTQQIVTQEDAKDSMIKGKLKELIPHIDFTKSNSDTARDLLKLAAEKGIATTFGSMTQLVAVQRRKQGQGDIPKSLRSKLDISVEMLDEAIQGLTDMREYLIATVEENRMLKVKLDRFRKAMEE